MVSDHALTDTDSTNSNLMVAYPLFRDAKPFGVVAVQTKGIPEQQQAVLQLLRWGSAWLELLMHQESQQRTDRLDIAFATLAIAWEPRRAPCDSRTLWSPVIPRAGGSEAASPSPASRSCWRETAARRLRLAPQALCLPRGWTLHRAAKYPQRG